MAFLAPHARQPVFQAPRVVVLLILLLVVAHVMRSLLPPGPSEAVILQFALVPARLSPAFLAQHGMGSALAQGFTLLSYMAIHNDYTHLAINSIWLLAFGPIVARRFGTALFLLFFLVCGVAAAAAHLALNWGSSDPVIGASGAISGLMAAGIRLLPTERPAWAAAGPPAQAPMLPLLSRQVILFSLVWTILNIAAAFTGLGLPAAGAGVIAWQAHLGGYAAGLLLSGPFDALRPQKVEEQI